MIDWFGQQFMDQLKEHVKPGLEEAGRLYVDTVWAKLQTPYPPESTPGTPPHMRSGDLAASYDYIVTEEGHNLVLITGSRLYYSMVLEQGGVSNWGRIEPRPHIVSTFVEVADEMAALILMV